MRVTGEQLLEKAAQALEDEDIKTVVIGLPRNIAFFWYTGRVVRLTVDALEKVRRGEALTPREARNCVRCATWLAWEISANWASGAQEYKDLHKSAKALNTRAALKRQKKREEERKGNNSSERKGVGHL